MLYMCGMLTVCTIFHALNTGKYSSEYILTSCMVPGSYCHKTHIAESTVHTEDEGLWDQEAGEGAVLKWLWYLNYSTGMWYGMHCVYRSG